MPAPQGFEQGLLDFGVRALVLIGPGHRRQKFRTIQVRPEAAFHREAGPGERLIKTG